jgi:hypothetical protein
VSPGFAGCHVPVDRCRLTGGLVSRSVKPFQAGSDTAPTQGRLGAGASECPAPDRHIGLDIL